MSLTVRDVTSTAYGKVPDNALSSVGYRLMRAKQTRIDALPLLKPTGSWHVNMLVWRSF